MIRDLRGANVVVKDLARFDRTGGHRKRDRARDLDGRCGLMMLDLYECIVHGVCTAQLGDAKLGMTRRAAWTPVPGERAKQDGDRKMSYGSISTAGMKEVRMRVRRAC